MTPARQSAKPDRALTSSSRQGPEQEDSLTPQAPTLLISLFYLGGSAYWRWSGNESRGPIFCQNRHESMRQNQRVWNKPLVVKQSIGRRLSRSKTLPWFGVRCAHEHNWLPWAPLLLGVWMYIQHWGEMFATWETSDFLFGTLSKKKKNPLVSSPHYCAGPTNPHPKCSSARLCNYTLISTRGHSFNKDLIVWFQPALRLSGFRNKYSLKVRWLGSANHLFVHNCHKIS